MPVIGQLSIDLIGDHAKHIRLGAIAAGMDERKIHYNPSADLPEVSAADIFNNSKGESLLIKASRRIRLERVKELLKQYFSEEE